MEKQLSIVSKLSLQEMVQRRVVIHLWNEETILNCFLFDYNKYPPDNSVSCLGHFENYSQLQEYYELHILDSETFRQVTEIVKRKVFELPLPISVKKRMLHIVKIIGADMLGWKITLHTDISEDFEEYNDINILKQLSWTCAGTVDYKKTAEKLVCLESLDIVKRFKIACSCYLVDHIASLWEQLPKKYKKEFNKQHPMRSFEFDITRHEIYWFCVLTGLEIKLLSWDYQKAFRCSACKGNKAATEYYFQKLTDEERNSSLVRVASKVIEGRCRSRGLIFPIENLSHVLCYLLSLMSPADQMEVFEKQPCHFLRCLLDWPWHDLFMDNLDLVWNRLSENEYKDLFAYIAENISKSGFYFPKLFQMFFFRNSKNAQNRFAQEGCSSIIPEFFFVEDAEHLLMVLRNIDSTKRVELLTSHYFFESLDDLVMRDKFELVEVFLREDFQFIDREILKSKFMKWLKSEGRTTVEQRGRKRKLKELYESININHANSF